MSEWLVASPASWSPEVREVIRRRAPPGFEVRCSMAADAGWAELLARCDYLLVGMTRRWMRWTWRRPRRPGFR